MYLPGSLPPAPHLARQHVLARFFDRSEEEEDGSGACLIGWTGSHGAGHARFNLAFLEDLLSLGN